eukprot:TRINITY_DN11512_c0_g1_i9.p1 TRINITY_DN11512_c0_g1~~TRINITY_DN11512_c0_g1_i9.p1  ORF type:complete len:353 (+),score=60.91 TRINITY_DN11512_c0_g1_i9:83-1141(+)
MEQKQNHRLVVVYHYPCHDGVFSALAAFLWHKACRASEVVHWVPLKVFLGASAQVTQRIGGFQPGDEVYFVDITGGADFLIETANVVGATGRVVALDHHVSTIDEFKARADQPLPPNLELHFDIQRSGAMLSLDYFSTLLPAAVSWDDVLTSIYDAEQVPNDKRLSIETLRHIYGFIMDADLYTWKLDQSREFSAGLHALKLEYDIYANPSLFRTLLQFSIPDLITSGAASLQEIERIVAQEIDKSFVLRVPVGDAVVEMLAVETSYGDMRSRIGAALCDKAVSLGRRPMAAVTGTEAGLDADKMKISLRSQGAEDTAAISCAYGGGGHRNASSFVTSLANYESWKSVNFSA